MIQDRLDKIEAKVQSASNIPDDTRTQLLGLLADLKSEVAALDTPAPAEGSEPVDDTVDGLTGSVSEFETTHPQLTQLVNRLASLLSNTGI